MADNKRGYNGLRSIGGPGGVPVIGSGMGRPTEEQLRQAIVAEINGMARGIYESVAKSLIAKVPDTGKMPAEEFQALAQYCRVAAESFFVGIGMIQLEPPSEPADSSLASAIEQQADA